MDLLSTINHSISLVGRLREISKNITEAEFKNVLADLSNELADAKLQIASLKEENANLRQENNELKLVSAPAEKKPQLKWGCYQFEDNTGLYCTACYDTKRKKITVTRLNSKSHQCPVCKALLGA